MPGSRSRHALLAALFVALWGSVAAAQGLPELRELEMEDARLVLLDKDGARRGVLSGKRASRRADGSVLVETAEIRLARPDGELVVAAPEMTYTPAESSFRCPRGLTANLPDGGVLVVPGGEADLTAMDPPRLAVTAEGETTLRLGPEDAPLFCVVAQSPKVDLLLAATGAEVASCVVACTRGAEAGMRGAGLPAIGEAQEGPRGLLSMKCRGEARFALEPAEERFELAMFRRVEAKLEPGEEGAEPWSLVADEACLEGEMATESNPFDFRPDRLSAAGNVHLAGRNSKASGGRLLCITDANGRSVELSGGPEVEATLEDGESFVARARTLLRVVRRCDVEPARLALSGEDGVSVAGTPLRAPAWEIHGRLVACATWTERSFLGPEEDALRIWTLNADAEGFASLLRFGEQGDDLFTTCYGERLEALVHGGWAEATLFGPDALMVSWGEFGLARQMREALGLGEDDKDGGDPADHGRLSVRASERLELYLLAVQEAASGRRGIRRVHLHAVGANELEQRAVPRDDRDLVTLAAGELFLDLEDGKLIGASAQANDGDMRLTVGFDLLRCQGFTLRDIAGESTLVGDGPGLMVLRDEQTLERFRRSLPNLKSDESAPNPDAGRLVFETSLRWTRSGDGIHVEFVPASIELLRGDFVRPRVGQAAFRDLPELDDDDVSCLWEASGEKLVVARDEAVTSLRIEGAPRVEARADGISLRANSVIEVETERPLRSPDAAGRGRNGEEAPAPLRSSLRLAGQAEIRMARASDLVAQAGGALGGEWRLLAGDLLELERSPLESFFPKPAASDLSKLREELRSPGAPDLAMERLPKYLANIAALRGLLPRRAEAARVQLEKASDELRAAGRRLAYAWAAAGAGRSAEAFRSMQGARSGFARAAVLLEPQFQWRAEGGVRATLHGHEAGAAPLRLTMSGLTVALAADGRPLALQARGPIVAERGGVELRGSTLELESSGALTLQDAEVMLPDESGVELLGVQRIHLFEPLGRTPRVRVAGRELGVRLRLDAGK